MATVNKEVTGSLMCSDCDVWYHVDCQGSGIATFVILVQSKVKSMQRSGTEGIRTQIQPSKPKREKSKIKYNQNTRRTYGQPNEQLI